MMSRANFPEQMGYAGGGIYTMPHLAQMAGGGIYTIPMAGGGMYVPGYGWGGFFRGLNKVATVASYIPGPHQPYAAGTAIVSGELGKRLNGDDDKEESGAATKTGMYDNFDWLEPDQVSSLNKLSSLRGAMSSRATSPSGAEEEEPKAQGYAKIESFNGGGFARLEQAIRDGSLKDTLSNISGESGDENLSTLDKILKYANHPAMMAIGYPLLGELLGSVGRDSLGRMGPARSTTGEPIRRVMPSYVTDRRAQQYAEIPSRRHGGVMDEEYEMGVPDFMPQPVRPRRPIPEYTTPVIERRPDLNIDRPTGPEEELPSEEQREETSAVEDRFEEFEREVTSREGRRERGSSEGGGDLSGTEERTTGDGEQEGRGTSYEEGRYRYGDRMTEEQKRMAERFETQDEFGDADESAEIENIRAIAKGTPSDDIVSIDGTMIEGESPYDDSPTSMPGGRAPVVVGPPTGQFRPQAHEITDIPEWYRAGLMSEQALERGQPETFLGQDPFSVFVGQQQDPISMFRGPAAPQAPLQVPNMPFLQQGPPQLGPPPPIVDPGDKFSRPRIEAPRRMVSADRQMPQPVMGGPDFMPQPMQEMPVGRMLPPPQQRRSDDVAPVSKRKASEKSKGGLGGLKSRRGPRSTKALKGRADGGMTPQDIPFEGFIEPFEDGTMESSGAVDDRVAIMKPEISEVSSESMQMLDALKQAIRNPNSAVSQDIIALAESIFGKEFIMDLEAELRSSEGNTALEQQDDMDRLVEMEFRQNLAKGGPVRVGAAIAPNEYVLTASQVRNVGGGSTEEGARRIKKLARSIDIAGSRTDGPLNVEIA